MSMHACVGVHFMCTCVRHVQLEIHLTVLTGEGIATVEKIYDTDVGRSPIDAQVTIICLQRIPWAAA